MNLWFKKMHAFFIIILCDGKAITLTPMMNRGRPGVKSFIVSV
jgi:hypothetical protein